MRSELKVVLLGALGALGCSNELASVGAALRAREASASTASSATTSSASTPSASRTSVAGATTTGVAGSSGTTSTRPDVVVGLDGAVLDRVREPRLPSSVPWNRCDRRRLVGQVPWLSVACPEASGGWRLDRDRFVAAGRELGARFCGYDYVGSGWTLDGLPSLRRPTSDDVYVDTPPLQWLEPDCEAVVELANPQESEAIATYAKAHVENTRRHLDRLDALPRVAALSWFTPSLPQSVDVWILDSSPTDTTSVEPQRGSGSDHGYAVGLAMRDTVCPEGRAGVCPVRFRHRQVLDLDGGASGVGYIGDLADGVIDAVDGGARVIVLAVGFHEDYALFGDDETPAYHTAANALSHALNYAAQRDVAVIAAAGNAQFGPPASSYYGPDGLYPGEMTLAQAWSTSGSGAALDRPLVYAASAVDSLDQRAPNARLEGESSLVAPGFAQIFEDPFVGGYVVGGTGSSFAAAHVAAVVTLVRAYRPSARVPEVMRIVADSAVSLGRSAPLAARGLVADVRRVSACGAVAAAVRASCGYRRGCPVPTCRTWGAHEGTEPTEVDVDALLALALDAGAPSYQGVMALECDGDESRVEGDEAPASYCPEEHFANGIRTPEAVGSQPGVDPCGSCSIIFGSDRTTLVMGLDPLVASGLTSPVLQLGTKRYALPSTVMTISQSSVVKLVLPPLASPPASSSLSFLASDGTQSVTSHLPVYRTN